MRILLAVLIKWLCYFYAINQAYTEPQATKHRLPILCSLLTQSEVFGDLAVQLRFPDRKPYARQNPLHFIITTAGTDRHSIAYELHGFNTFSIYQVLPQLIELWGLNVQTDVEAKKNFVRQTVK